MDSFIKSVAKTAALNVGFTRTKILQREFLRSTPSCHGSYPSFAAAAAAAPTAECDGYDHRSIAEVARTRIGRFNFADYPVIFWLLHLLPTTRVIFELGGSIGLGFYAFERYLHIPATLRWIVCELPSMAALGEEVARERNVMQLIFTTERETPDNPEIYMTFGTLQYIEEPFTEILARLRQLPLHLLINRVPLTEGEAFITLQNNGSWFSPYKVGNKTAFTQDLVDLGYELVDQWDAERANTFFLEQEVPLPRYCGMYLRRK